MPGKSGGGGKSSSGGSSSASRSRTRQRRGTKRQTIKRTEAREFVDAKPQRIRLRFSATLKK